MDVGDIDGIKDFIRGADFFALESIGREIPDAETKEKEWDRIINSGMSRSEFRRKEEQRKGARLYEMWREYIIEFNTRLFMSHVALIYAERFPPGEGTKIAALSDMTYREKIEGIRTIYEGKKSAGLEQVYAALGKELEVMKARDSNMGGNVPLLEGILRSTYPHLAEKNTLVGYLHIGGAHSPEEYTIPRLPVIPVGKRDDVDGLLLDIHGQMRQGADLSVLEPLIMNLTSILGPKLPKRQALPSYLTPGALREFIEF
jgi:hypothetical protein